MKLLFKLACLLLLSFSYSHVFSQATGYQLKVDTVHYGVIGNTDLNGYVTYDLCVTFTNPTDYLSAVYASMCPTDPGYNAAIDTCNIELFFDGDVYQNEFGQLTVLGQNPVFCNGPEPELCYDSFLTITSQLSTQDPIFTAFSCPLGPAIAAEWDANNHLFIDDGTWFTIGPNGVAGADLSVEIMQITTTGGMQGCFCIQVFPLGNQNPNAIQYIKICIDEENPCIANDLVPSFEILEPIDCNGNTATVQIGDGTGNGQIDYTLLNVDDPNNPVVVSTGTNMVINNIPGGSSYAVAMVDAVYCRDTSLVFYIDEPDTLILTSELVSDVLCGGNANGEILNNAEGGTAPYVFSSNAGPDLISGQSWENLDCGVYNVTVTDDNDCVASGQIEVACPAPLAIQMVTTNVDCFGAENGQLTGQVSGGSGQITAVWTCNGTDMDPIVGPSPLNITISDLGPCDYSLVVTDENGCEILGLFGVSEPAPLTTLVNVNDVSCFGICDGTIVVQPFGGTPESVTVCVDLNTGSVVSGNLCAGDYECTTIDANGCTVVDTVLVDTPSQITYDIITNDASCFGVTDGSILIDNLAGGDGVVSLAINPLSGTAVAPPDLGFVNVQAGVYSLTFTDGANGCTYSGGSVTIIQPAQLSTNLVVTNISCFGFNDGMVEIACNGGTGAVTIDYDGATFACPATITDLSPDSPTTFTLTDESLCTASSSFTIEEPEVLELDVTGTIDVICGGGNTGGVQYVYDGGTGDISFEVDAQPASVFDLVQLFAGYHELCAFDENGCLACDTFTVSEPPAIVITIMTEDVTCTGMTDGSANVFAEGGTGDLFVEVDPSNIDLNNLAEGAYIVIATDELGCLRQDTIIIGSELETDMEFMLSSSPVTCWNTMDGTATIAISNGHPPFDILWSDPLEQTTATAVGLIEGPYFVNVIDDIGCTRDAMVIVQPNVGCFFIATALTPNGDGANDEWIVGGLEHFPSATVQVWNRWGQIIYESTGYAVPWDGTYDGQKVGVADYYFMITYDEAESPITGTVTVKY
jgi:gliding motility-associated-like protein